MQWKETVDSKASSSIARYFLGNDAIARRYFVFGIDDGGNTLSARLRSYRWQEGALDCYKP